MIKKISLEELRSGMYVCGMEKAAGKPVFFMNNILLKSQSDIEKMAGNGYACVYITVEEAPGPPVARIEAPEAAPAIEPAPAPEMEPQTEPIESAEPAELEAVSEPAIEEPPAQEAFQATPAWEDIPEEIVEATELAGIEELEVINEIKEVEPEEAPSLAETSFEEEIKEAHRLRNDAELLVREFLQNARLGKDVDTARVGGTVGRMVDSVFRNMDALTSLARLKSFDDYTFAHCVNVSILSITLGRQMGLERERSGRARHRRDPPRHRQDARP